MPLKSGYIIFLFAAALFSGCTSRQQTSVEEQKLFQVSTIDALLQGDYDGYTSLKEISGKGNFGIGTVNALDGELVLENSNFYQVKSDGKVYRPSSEMKTPFASVVKFSPEDSLEIRNINFLQLKAMVDSLMQSKNYFYANLTLFVPEAFLPSINHIHRCLLLHKTNLNLLFGKPKAN